MDENRLKYLKERANQLLQAFKHSTGVDKALDELQVYHVELELQNDELINAQADLARSRDSFRDLFMTAPVGFLIITGNGLICKFNLTFAAMVGDDAAKISWAPFSSFIEKNYQSNFFAFLNETIASHHPHTFSLALLGRKNKITYVKGDCRPLASYPFEDKPERVEPYFLLTLTEINDLVETQKLLEEERMQSSESARLKTDFLARMSHEIRTPMNGIIGMTDLALDTENQEEKNSYLETVRRAGTHLLSILNDILDLSKLEESNLSLRQETVWIRKIILDVEKTFFQPTAQKDLKLIVSISDDFPEILIGDGRRLQQILNNLISNAIKFTESGFVKIEAKRSDVATPELPNKI